LTELELRIDGDNWRCRRDNYRWRSLSRWRLDFDPVSCCAPMRHLAQARRHFDDMLGSKKPEPINPPEPTESDKAAPRKEGDF
jgi:hypothetical protein